MKTCTALLFVMVMGSSMLFAQVGINDDGSLPNPSAGLDVKFSNKGFLLPRLTLSQRNGIATPTEGLMVYCTDCGTNGSVSIFSAGVWRTFSFCSCPYPGEGINLLSPGRILWSWTAVPEATGYKWHTVNDYSAAIDMGTTLTKMEYGTACNTAYTRYVWAYNTCSVSEPLALVAGTPPSPPATPAAGPHIATKYQITWNWTTVANATGYRWSSVDDFTTATDMGLMNSKTEGSLACQTLYTRYVWAYNGCDYSMPVTLTRSTLDCYICGEALTVNHLATGGVAPVDKTVTYNSVNNVPGELAKCWITSNLGASRQATEVNDTTEASAGWYWQFNVKQGYKYGLSRVPNTIWNSTISQISNWVTENDPCDHELGSGWRVPTYTEWNNIFSSGGWTNWNGPWNSLLKIHAGGHIDYNMGVLYNRGVDGYYWSSTQIDSEKGWSLGFWNSYCGLYSSTKKANAFNVRCIRN